MFIPSLRHHAQRHKCFMENQCRVCIRERKMKARKAAILAVCFAIVTFQSPTAGVEVSSKVDLDSDENEDTSSNMALGAIEEDSSKSAYTSESVSRTSKQPEAGWRRESEFVKLREPKKRRIHTADDSSAQPKVINNIQIVVNSNDSLRSVNSCKRGVCDVSVTSTPDGKGNIVTEVRLSIVTSAKPNIQMNDVPVINSFRGVRKEPNERSIVLSTYAPTQWRPPLHRDYTPQIQSNYHSEPWYQHRRNFQGPPMYWGYQNVGDRGDGFRGRKTWSQERAIVDDKIEPPLSKTKSGNNTDS